jgi:hypothetical protein
MTLSMNVATYKKTNAINYLHYRNFRKAAGAIPIDYDYTAQPPIADTEQLKSKQTRLQWLFDSGMKCDEYITWGTCLAGDIST